MRGFDRTQIARTKRFSSGLLVANWICDRSTSQSPRQQVEVLELLDCISKKDIFPQFTFDLQPI